MANKTSRLPMFTHLRFPRFVRRLSLLLIAPSVLATPALAQQDRFQVPSTHPVWESDRYWTRDFATPDLDGGGTVVGVSGSDLLVGGYFTQIDGVEAAGLARLEGRGWRAAPIDRSSYPSAMLADGASMLIAGDFADPSTRARVSVVRWRQDAITPVGGAEMRGRIVRLFQWQGALIAAGSLAFEDHPDGRFLLARFDGTRWTPLGPASGDDRGTVTDAMPFRGRIMVAGRFGDWPFLRSLLELSQDESTFQTVYSSVVISGLERLEVHADRLVAAGYFNFPPEDFPSLSNRPYRNLAAWDGAAWTPLDDDFGGQVSALLSTSSGLLIGGPLGTIDPASPRVYFNVARLSPSGLTMLGQLQGMSVLSFAEWQGKVVACGRRIQQVFESEGSSLQLAVFDGTGWHAPRVPATRAPGLDSHYPSPGNTSVQAFLEADGSWFAAGRFDLAWSEDRWKHVGQVARWNGTGWESYGQGLSQGSARAIAWYRGQLYAAGSFNLQTPTTYVSARLIRSDGTQWLPVEGEPAGEIRTLAVFGDRLYAGGTFDVAGGVPVNGIASFDGGSWAAVGDGTPAPSITATRITALLVHRDALYVGGLFEGMGGVQTPGIARWDGRSWSAVGDGYNGDVQAMVEYGGRLTVAGFCNGTPPCGNIVSWNGARWTPIAEAPSNVVTMAARGDILFVGGYFPGTSVYENGNVAAWDGRVWHSLGSGLARELRTAAAVSALGLRDNVLWVGGSFGRAGGQPATNIATWTGLTRQGRSERRHDFDIFADPNPSRPGKDIDFSIAGEGSAEVGIYDVTGRRLHTVRTVPGAGGATATWDGRDADGKTVPAGIYFARAIREGRVIATRRLVRLP